MNNSLNELKSFIEYIDESLKLSPYAKEHTFKAKISNFFKSIQIFSENKNYDNASIYLDKEDMVYLKNKYTPILKNLQEEQRIRKIKSLEIAIENSKKELEQLKTK